MKTIALLFASVGLLFVSSCNPRANQTVETPTRGNIKMSSDESFKLLIEAELATFKSYYQYANINIMYKPEYDVISDFMKDSVKTIVTAQKLTKEQEDYLLSRSFRARTTVIAKDALAFIVNNNNVDSLIRITDLKQMFLGGVTNWNQISKKNNAGKIQIVFDNNKSTNARYMLEKLRMTEFSSNCYSANSNEEVINHVEKNKNAIGIISVNWISENNDSISNNFLKRITVVGLTSELNPEGLQYYRPYAAYIKDESYPFIRDVYMISRETFAGLGSGFTSFIAGEKGQRVVLKAGLVPATMPVRVVEMKTKQIF